MPSLSMKDFFIKNDQHLTKLVAKIWLYLGSSDLPCFFCKLKWTERERQKERAVWWTGWSCISPLSTTLLLEGHSQIDASR